MTSVYMIRTQDIEPMVYGNLNNAANMLAMYAHDMEIKATEVKEMVKRHGSFRVSNGMKFAEVQKLTVRTGV